MGSAWPRAPRPEGLGALRPYGGDVTAQLLVQSVVSGRVVKTVDMESAMAVSPFEPSSFTQVMPLLCNIPRGTYKLLIAGTTHDAAGNRWESAVCHGRLRVR